MKHQPLFFFLFSIYFLFAQLPSSFAGHEIQQKPNTAAVSGEQAREVTSGLLAQQATALLQVELGNVTSSIALVAANPNDNAMYVSALRVDLRRSLAALTICRDLLPEADFQWVKQQLTQLRITTDTLSDDDALNQILTKEFSCCAGKYPFGDFQVERNQDQQPLLDLLGSLQKDDLFKNRVDQMLQKVAWPTQNGEEPTFSELAKTKLLICLGETFQPLPTEETSYVELHQFRIRIKKLRYMVELLEDIFPPENYVAIDPPLVLLQSTLGRIHDLFNLEQKVQEKLNNPIGLDPELLFQVQTTDQELLQQAHQDFFLNFTPAYFEKLQDDIKTAINLL